MKKFLFLIHCLFILNMAGITQSPTFFNYQGVARNSVGNAIINKNLSLRLSIHDGSSLGLIQYSEVKQVTTNAFGLFNVQVGSGQPLSGSMQAVIWNNGTKWLQVEIDPEGGTAFKDIGTTQLSSVPYSLFSNQASDMVLPFNKSQNESVPLLRITNTGNNASSLAFEAISNSTANNAVAIRGVMSSGTQGVNAAAVYGQNNGTGVNGIGVYGAHNGSGWGVYGTSPGGVGLYGNSNTGTGVYGISNNGPSVMGFQPSTGTANAGLFQNFSTSNGSAVLRSLSNGTGEGLNVTMDGMGKGSVIQINNAANLTNALEVSSNGQGRVGLFQNTNTGNILPTLEVINLGLGRTGTFINNNIGNTLPVLGAQTNGPGDAIQSMATGTGKAGLFNVNNVNNANNVLDVTTNGLGRAGYFQNTNGANASNVFEVVSNGAGFAANFRSTNAVPRALRTTGAIQFTGVGESPNRIMSTVDGSGTATWQSPAAIGIVTGTGNQNFLARWTPNGTNLGNSQIQDDGNNLGIGTSINANFKVSMAGKLRVVADVSDTAVAYFENTSGGVNSDGIVIKLGRTHPMWKGSVYAHIDNAMTLGVQTQMDQIRNWIYGVDTFNWEDLINLMPSQFLAGTICNLTNYVTTKINSEIGLPIGVPRVDVGRQMLIALNSVADPLIADGWIDDITGTFVIPAFQFPAIPQLNCSGLPTLTWPEFQFTEVNNSLTKKNEFISFVDKDNRQLGSIRAQSIQDFSYDYFDGQKMLDLAAEIIGIDIVDDFMSIISGLSQMLNDYNNIGVEYASGHGDYAEWLERINPSEDISYGDIVAVKGGRVTKDLSGAQQIMAVSKNPIVLGNVPQAGKTEKGNNIAFMGQIPVKVMGSVQSGDYIVAKGEIPGYGVAIHPKDMTVEDFKLSVGRSWDNNSKAGPKMVNTVVGVHNNDFLNIIGHLQQKAEQTDVRLHAIENMLQLKGSTETQIEPVKKGFE